MDEIDMTGELQELGRRLTKPLLTEEQESDLLQNIMSDEEDYLSRRLLELHWISLKRQYAENVAKEASDEADEL